MSESWPIESAVTDLAEIAIHDRHVVQVFDIGIDRWIHGAIHLHGIHGAIHLGGRCHFTSRPTCWLAFRTSCGRCEGRCHKVSKVSKVSARHLTSLSSLLTSLSCTTLRVVGITTRSVVQLIREAHFQWRSERRLPTSWGPLRPELIHRIFKYKAINLLVPFSGRLC